MIKTLLALSLAAATGLASAATGGADTDREARRAEWQARAEARFTAADVDKDGRIDRVEAAALGERFIARFDRLDADSDGALTKEELQAARRMQRGPGRGGHGARGMSYMAGLLRGMDDDGNGAISRAELGNKAPMLVENFSVIDLDNNGELGRDELRAFHLAKRAEHAQARAARGEGERHPRRHRGENTPR